MKIINSCPLLGRIVFCTFFHSSQLSNRIHSIDANLSSTTALDGPKITHQLNWPFHETESPFVMQSSCGFRLFVEWGDSGTVHIHSVCLYVCLLISPQWLRVRWRKKAGMTKWLWNGSYRFMKCHELSSSPKCRINLFWFLPLSYSSS